MSSVQLISLDMSTSGIPFQKMSPDYHEPVLTERTSILTNHMERFAPRTDRLTANHFAGNEMKQMAEHLKLVEKTSETPPTELTQLSSLPILHRQYVHGIDRCSDAMKRFSCDEKINVLAVLDDDGRPLGVLQRASFCKAMSISVIRFQRYRRSVASMMLTNMVTGCTTQSVLGFIQTLSRNRTGPSLREFVLIDAYGRYAGVCDGLSLVHSVVENNRKLISALAEKTRALRRSNFALTQKVVERDHAAKSARKLANLDSLTGLANRRCFLADCEERIKLGRPSTIMFIDLDGFKAVNDRFGHAAGDAVLREVSKRLNSLAVLGVIARLGGDEFALSLEGAMSRQDAMKLGQNIHKELMRPVNVGETELSVGASIGVSRFPDDAETSSEIIHMADMAMLSAKRSGSGVQIHEASGQA